MKAEKRRAKPNGKRPKRKGALLRPFTAAEMLGPTFRIQKRGESEWRVYPVGPCGYIPPNGIRNKEVTA